MSGCISSIPETLLRLFVGSSIQGHRFRICLGFSLSSANDNASWKCDIGWPAWNGLSLYQDLRELCMEIYLKKKKVLGIISKSKLLHKSATCLPANEQQKPCVEQLGFSKTCHCHVSSQCRSGRCMLSAGSPTAASALEALLEI